LVDHRAGERARVVGYDKVGFDVREPFAAMRSDPLTLRIDG
jgi:hypothetical protein